MGTLLLVARIGLAAVFVTAGVAKLFDREGSREALAGFGVRARFVPLGAVVLPVAELAIAGALIPQPSARWGALGALALLLAFVGGIAGALSRGEAPDCHCFGQLHSAPVGRGVLARNLALAAVAAWIALRGPGTAVTESGVTTGAVAAAALAVAAVLGAVAVRLWLDMRGVQEELDAARRELAALPAGLPVGARAPRFELPDISGTSQTLEAILTRGRPLALVFVSPDCESCGELMPDLARWQTTLADRVTVAVITHGTLEANRSAAEENGLSDVLLQQDVEILRAYRITSTPTAVTVTTGRRIASHPAEGPVAIESLIRLTLRRGASGSDALRDRATQPVG